MMCELQLLIYQLVGTVVVDKKFRLFKVGSGGKWGIAVFWFPDVTLNGVFAWTVELGSKDNVYWAP